MGVRGTLLFSSIRRLGPFLGVHNFEFHHFLWGGGVGKNNIFGGMKLCVYFWGGHHTIGLVLGSFLCILWYFLKGDGNPHDYYVLYERS